MVRWLRSWLRDWRDPHVPLADVLRDTRKKLQADPMPPPRVIYAEPNRAKTASEDILGLVLQREAEQARQPKNVLSIRARAVKS